MSVKEIDSSSNTSWNRLLNCSVVGHLQLFGIVGSEM
jgi:hypothetical protein